MKLISKLAAALLILGASASAWAFTYHDQDLLLVFRRAGYPDALFNLGAVSNYLGKTDGTRLAVTQWDSAEALQSFDGSLEGVSMILLACTTTTDPVRRIWISDGTASDHPTDQSGSRWGQLRSKIDYIGVQAMSVTQTNSLAQFISSPGESYSYSYIVSGGGALDAATMSGLAPCNVEGLVPTSVRFFEVKVNNNTPKPAAIRVGAFEITAEGALTFVAGADDLGPLISPTVTAISHAAGTTSVRFTSNSGVSYRLRASDDLTLPPSQWTILPAAVSGNGSEQTLTDASPGHQRYYLVEAFR